MKIDLEPAKNVLRRFLSEFDEVKEFQNFTSKPAMAPFKIEDREPDFSGMECAPTPNNELEKDEASPKPKTVIRLISGHTLYRLRHIF